MIKERPLELNDGPKGEGKGRGEALRRGEALLCEPHKGFVVIPLQYWQPDVLKGEIFLLRVIQREKVQIKTDCVFIPCAKSNLYAV